MLNRVSHFAEFGRRVQLDASWGTFKRLISAALVSLCVILFLAGPGVATLLPVPTAQGNSSEEENERVEAEEFCSRTAPKRLVLRAELADWQLNAPSEASPAGVSFDSNFSPRPSGRLDRDVNLGAGAPLRC